MGTSGVEAHEWGTTRSDVTVGDVSVEQHHVTDTTSGGDGMEGLRRSLRRLTRAECIGPRHDGRFLTFPLVTYEPNRHDDPASHGSTAQ
jgi:hypothetical protein